MAKVNLLDLIDRYNCDDKCRDTLELLRWPSGVACTRCGDTNVLELPKQHRWLCRGCRYQFSVTSGTIMHDSHLPLRKWFLAIYMMCESKRGISAHQLHRTLGVAYRTAWYLCHRIREAMGNDPLDGPTLLGVVEVDETWIGGKGAGYKGNKIIVAGAIQRGGRIRMERIPNVRKPTLHNFIARTVEDEADAMYTDELASYLGIADDDTRRATVSHSTEQSVLDDVHTNSIESLWALFKRSIMGTFPHISAKHLDRYLEEMEWRFNNRDNPYIFMDTLRRMLGCEHLTYRELIGRAV